MVNMTFKKSECGRICPAVLDLVTYHVAEAVELFIFVAMTHFVSYSAKIHRYRFTYLNLLITM